MKIKVYKGKVTQKKGKYIILDPVHVLPIRGRRGGGGGTRKDKLTT